MPATSKVVRHSRHEFVKHDAEAAAEIQAGQGVVENGDGTVSPGSDGSDRLLVAEDDRESRSMQIGDSYDAGEYLIYLAVSGGGINVLMPGGTTVDPATENRIVQDADGYFRPFDGGAGDVEADVVGYVDEDEAITADAGTPEPFSIEVA